MTTGAGLAVHDRPRDEGARPGLRGRDLRVRRRRSTAAVTRAAAWAWTPRATSTSPPATRTPRGHQRLLGQQPAAEVPAAQPDAGPWGAGQQPGLRRAQLLLPGRAPHCRDDQRLQRQDAALQPDRRDPRREQPEVGIGTTYELPTAESPNGPNLFDGTEGNGDQAKPEIYAMGLRNPSRLSIDPETDIPYTAWVGPDAGGPSRDAGPLDVRERRADRAGRQLRLAVLHGQPAGLPRPRRRRRTADYERGGVRLGRSRGRADPGLLRLRQPRQRLPNNTGLTVLPHETGTGHGRGHRAPGQRLVQPRQPRRRQRLPGLPAAERRTRLRRHARAALPVRYRVGGDDLGRPGLSLRRGDRRPVGRLARVLERALVHARLRNNNSVKHALLDGPGDRPGRLAADLRGQPPRQRRPEPQLAGELHGLEVRAGRLATTSRSTRGSSRPARRPGSIASPTRAAAPRRAPTRSGRPPATRSRSSSRTAPRAASRGSGTSTTTARSTRPRPIRSTPTRRTARMR